ncbi:13714_t:CDS:2, partial [Dentiscutata erythropus]
SSGSKLRNIAPAPQNKPEYDVYHIPRGYEVLLYPTDLLLNLPKIVPLQVVHGVNNCFMAYREQIQHKVLEENPGMNNKLVSVIAAKMWNEESEEVKQFWRE